MMAFDAMTPDTASVDGDNCRRVVVVTTSAFARLDLYLPVASVNN
jgi:hypothetical protein